MNPASAQPTFASLDTLHPCMIKLCIAGISTIIEPSTTADATATLARFLDNAALGAAVAAMYHR